MDRLLSNDSWEKLIVSFCMISTIGNNVFLLWYGQFNNLIFIVGYNTTVD